MRLNEKVYIRWCARPKERMGLRICVLFVIRTELYFRILLSVFRILAVRYLLHVKVSCNPQPPDGRLQFPFTVCPVEVQHPLGRTQRQISRPAIDRVEYGDLVAGDITLLRLAHHREVEQGQLLPAGEALEEVPQLVVARHHDEPLRAGHAVARRVRRHLGPALRQLAPQGLFVAAVPDLEGVAVSAIKETDLIDHSLGGGVSDRLSASAPPLGSSGGMVGGGAIGLRLVRRCRLLELLGMMESLKMLKSLNLFVGQIEGHGG